MWQVRTLVNVEIIKEQKILKSVSFCLERDPNCCILFGALAAIFEKMARPLTLSLQRKKINFNAFS
jgi:hypothetical protein